MSSTPVVFSDQDIDQSGQSSKPITFGEDEIQHAPHDFTQEALSGKLAPVTGKPAEPKGQPYIDRSGMEHETEAVPEAAGWRDPLIHIAAGAEPVATGLSRIKDNSAPPVSPEMPMGRSRGGPAILPQAPHTPEQVQRDRQTMLGGAEVLQGTGQLGTVALPAALAAAPLKVGAGLAAGTLASEAAGKTVHGKVSPEAEELTRAAAFFIPSAAGVVSGLKTGTVETPQGKFSAASIFGGKAGAGVRTTPEGTFARVKVGGTTIEVPISRNGAPAPAEAPAPAAPLPAGVTSMVKANAAEAMAKNVVAGRPPVPPPPAPPPTPGEQFGNKLSGDQVDHLAKTIAGQPEAKRNGLIEEAHQNLTQWMADNKGKVIIDGKVHIAKTPDQAETLAAKLVNDAVAQHDKQHSAVSTQQSAKPEPEAASPVKQFLASSRPASTTEARRPGEETGKSAKTVQNAQNVQIPPVSQAAPVQELQAPTPKPVQASLGNEAAVVPPEPQTTQNLTANEGATGEVIPPRKPGELHPDKLDYGAWSLFGKENFSDLSQQQKDAVVRTYTKTTAGQSIATPEGRHFIATGEKQGPIIEGNNPKEIQQFAEQDIQPERRTNVAERKRVAEMSPEEMARELHTSRLDNGDGTHTEMPIPNGRAFHDAPASPAVAMSDSDGLKAFNDKFGYKAGNAILVAKGEAAKEAGLDAYHQKGDEFLYHGESPEHLKSGLEKAREILRNREFTVTDATGKQVTLKGVDFSYGTGTDLNAAESGLKAHKQQREASGERARGELRGITQVGHEAAAEGGSKEAASESASEVTPQTFHESDIEHELPEGVPAKGKSGEVPTGLLHFDPKRFQYKLNVNEKGVTNLLHGQKFNQDLAGVVSVWHDPEDGKLYVVNGHHRAQLAKETGHDTLLVRNLDVATAGEARAVGALQNIAEGRGTAIDAAKFFRDRGISPEDLSKHGISLGEAKAADGLALSRLDQSIFERVATGKMSEGRGVAIGQATTDPAQQEAIVKLLDKREKQGKNITDAMVAELARFVGNSGNKTIEQGGLFGANQQIHSLALEKAEISAHIKGQIAKERRVFGSVATEDKAAALGQVKGQKLKAEQNKRIADAAGQAEEAYNKLSSHAGPVNDILEKSAKELASGYHKPEDVKARAYRDVRDEIRKVVTGSEGQSAERVQEHPEHGKEDAGNADRQASVKQPPALEELRKPKHNPDEPVLPGMEPHIAAEKESIAAKQGEDLTREIAAPKESISAKAGEMERNSPLFRDTEASGQSGLFNRPATPTKGDTVTLADGREGTVQYVHPEMNIARVKTGDGKTQTVGLKTFKDKGGRVVLTPKEADAVSWALDPMRDFWLDTEDRGGDHPVKIGEIVKQEGTGISINKNHPDSADVLDDLLYRLEEQTGSIGDPEVISEDRSFVRNAKAAAKKIRSAIKTDRSGEAGFAKLDIPSAVADLVKAAHEKVFAPTENRIARGVDDTLYQLGKQYDADVLRTIKLLKSVGPTTSPEDQEAIYHHKEDSSVHLNQRQQGTLDNVVQPLIDTNSEMRAKLNNAGIPMGEDDGYIHRVVQGKNNPLERAMRGKGGTGKGNVLSKAASSLKGRRMFAAEDEDGKRVVIHRNGDTMTAFDNGSASEFAKDKPGLQVGDEFNSKDGQRWTLKQATTKQIEEHTGVRYYKSALANTVVDYLQLRRAERANDALEGMKADPEFKSLSFKPEHGEMPPDGWRAVNLPQFNGYYFEPHMAETLDRFADELRADPAGAMEKIGNLMTASLVLNPARHVYNIGNHWLVERGVTGNFNPLIWPRSAKAGIRAIKAVMTQNDDFVNALDHGAPMMSHRQDLRELHQHLVDSMLGFLQQHSDVAAKIAELGGHLNHVDMLKGLYKLGQKMTWMSNDMFFLQSIYEKELGGMKFDDAAAETAKHIPDYRIPSRVLNSPGLSKFMNSHLLTVFSRYHYGVWKSYGQMLKEVAGPESSLKDRAKGLDHMLMLGLLTFVGYELWDKLLKHVTGDPKARMVRSGASAVPYLVNEIAKGNKPPEELIQGTFTPAVLPKTAAELAFNRDLYSGGRIYDRHDPATTIAHDVGKKTLGALGPSQQAEKAERSDTPMRDFLAYQGGVTFPNTEVQSPAVRLMHEILRENMTLTPELQRQLDDKRARIQSGNLTQKERKTQLKKEALDELSYYLPHVARYSDVKKVFNAATPEEKEIIRPIMLKKAVNVMRNNPIEGEREGALQAFEER